MKNKGRSERGFFFEISVLFVYLRCFESGPAGVFRADIGGVAQGGLADSVLLPLHPKSPEERLGHVHCRDRYLETRPFFRCIWPVLGPSFRIFTHV